MRLWWVGSAAGELFSAQPASSARSSLTKVAPAPTFESSQRRVESQMRMYGRGLVPGRAASKHSDDVNANAAAADRTGAQLAAHQARRRPILL